MSRVPAQAPVADQLPPRLRIAPRIGRPRSGTFGPRALNSCHDATKFRLQRVTTDLSAGTRLPRACHEIRAYCGSRGCATKVVLGRRHFMASCHEMPCGGPVALWMRLWLLIGY